MREVIVGKYFLCAARGVLSQVSTVERKLFAFTLTLLAPHLAHAAHPPRSLKTEGTAGEHQFVAAKADSRGFVFPRQVLAAQGTGDQLAKSRVIYLNRDGAILAPGLNDSRTDRSSVV